MSSMSSPPNALDDLVSTPEMPGHVASEAEFLEAVQAGIDSAADGPNRGLDEIEADIGRLLPRR